MGRDNTTLVPSPGVDSILTSPPEFLHRSDKPYNPKPQKLFALIAAINDIEASTTRRTGEMKTSNET